MWLSVVTPIRNAAEAVAETHASLRGAPAGVEWIVQDGASGDATLAVLAGLADPVPQVASAADDGLYQAIDRGLARASGDYVLVLGAGDRLAGGDMLARLAAALAERPDMIFGAALEDAAGGVRTKRCRPPGSLWRGLPTHHPAIVFRRALVAGLCHDPALKVAADYAFVWDAWRRAAKVAVVDFPICRCAPAGFSARHARLGRDEQWRVRRRRGVSWPVSAAVWTAQTLSWHLRRIAPGLWGRLRFAR
ncbi:MAG: glycosyltransferase [Rhodospirillaceae bacterium]|nr:glycosyltransferase [Rhodospirillaceae bacterium]